MAIGELKEVGVFGNDYPTPDGTGVRDYIHVVDLAKGHVAAIEHCEKSGVYVYNLGTGVGYSVMDVIHAYEKACGHAIPYSVKPRRPGDIAACYADASKAERELGWKARYGIDEMCASSWNWQKKQPQRIRKITASARRPRGDGCNAPRKFCLCGARFLQVCYNACPGKGSAHKKFYNFITTL